MGFYILVDGLSHYFYMGSLACPARFERATYALEGRCSIQLSYGQMDFLDFNGMLEPWEFGIGL